MGTDNDLTTQAIVARPEGTSQPEGLIFSAQASAPNEIAVTACNLTGAPVTADDVGLTFLAISLGS